jgi:ABC-2 type transport system permease protein
MFKLLLQNRIRDFFHSLTRSGRSTSTNSHASLKALGFGLLFLYCFGVFAFLAGLLFKQIAQPFHTLGIDWLYFTMAFLLAFTLMFIGSIFAAKSQLYEARDTELLLSLPIRPGAILASRMTLLLLLNIVFELMILGPAAWQYYSTIPAQPLSCLFFLVLALTLPLFSVGVSSLGGWLLTLVSTRTRYKSLFTILFSLVFLAAYFYFYLNAGKYVAQLVANGAAIADALDTPNPLFWIGMASATGDPLSFLLALLTLLIPFSLIVRILTVTFFKLSTTNRGAKKIKYRENTLRIHSANSALLRKDLRQFLSCPGYLLNSGIGILMALLGSGFLLARPNTLSLLLEVYPESKTLTMPILIGILCALSATVTITAPSLSIEGSRLWISRSLPITSEDILRAKLRLHMIMTTPAMVLAALAALWVLKVSPLVSGLVIVILFLFIWFSALLGLAENLRYPKLDYISETAAAKQSVSVLLTMLFTMLTALAVGGVTALLVLWSVPPLFSLLPSLALLTVGCLLLHHWVFQQGAAQLETL